MLYFLGAIALFAIAVFQIVMGWVGAEHYFGWWAGLGVTALAVMFRFTLPATIFCFFGCIEVLDWHWLVALGVAAPGLLLMVPALIGGAVGAIKDKASGGRA